MPHPCLLVENPPRPERTVALCQLGLWPWSVGDLGDACALLRQWHFEAVLVDVAGAWALLHEALHDICSHAEAPVLWVCDAVDEATQLQALRLGLTDSLERATSPRLQAAKLHRLATGPLQAPRSGGTLCVGALRLVRHAGAAFVGEQALDLTPQQFRMLSLLAEKAGQVVQRDFVYAACGFTAGRAADRSVCKLRKRLARSGVDVELRTAYRRGWALVPRRATAAVAATPQPARGASLAT